MESIKGANLIQIAFADDLTGVGAVKDLKLWWDMVLNYGPYLVYYVNETKSWLIVKEEHLEQAKTSFHGSSLTISTEGHRHLGTVVGTDENKERFVNDTVETWVKQINKLSEFACTQPHAAFCAYIHGLRHRYTYVMRTIPNISMLLKPHDEAVNNLIKVSLNGYSFNNAERQLFSLPAKFGGIGITIVSEISDQEYNNLRAVTRQTTVNVKQQKRTL